MGRETAIIFLIVVAMAASMAGVVVGLGTQNAVLAVVSIIALGGAYACLLTR